MTISTRKACLFNVQVVERHALGKQHVGNEADTEECHKTINGLHRTCEFLLALSLTILSSTVKAALVSSPVIAHADYCLRPRACSQLHGLIAYAFSHDRADVARNCDQRRLC